MQHRSSAIAIVAAVSLAACGSHGPSSTANVGNRAAGGAGARGEASMVGTFSATHTVMMVCDGPDLCEEEVTDQLVVAESGGGALAVSIELVQDNGHTCTFEQRLERDPEDRDRWRFHADDDGDEGPCDLTLTRLPDRLEIGSEGCRYYCGARASLDASFPFDGSPHLP